MSTSTSKETWLVTGSSQGLGYYIVLHALKAGHKVLAGTRNPSKSTPEIETVKKAGGIWIELDVSATDLEARLEPILGEHGPVDVLVNNAGYAYGGAVEDTPIDLAHLIFATNLFGPARLIKALLPSMRTRRHGTILNITSSEALTPIMGTAYYSASKAALDNLSAALALEVADFGIRVLSALPGGMRTEFLAGALESGTVPLSEPYQTGSMGKMLGAMSGMVASGQWGGHFRGDPEKVAGRLVEWVDGMGVLGGIGWMGGKLPLTGEAGVAVERKIAELVEMKEKLGGVWGEVDLLAEG